MLKKEAELPLPSKCCTKYDGIAFDGCWFYLTAHNECRIVKFDKCFHQEKCFDTCKNYVGICYDSKEKCFWATNDKSLSTIYKLNECFEEIDCIRICTPEIIRSVLTGITYDCCHDTLIVSNMSIILCVNKYNSFDTKVMKEESKECIMGVAAFCPYYIYHSFICGKNKIQIYSYCGKLVKEICLPCDYCVKAIVFNPCKRGYDNCHFYFLVTKHNCYSYIWDCFIEFNKICGSINECNYKICDCHHERPHKKPCEDILESIALVETSIAHILNAEGEKLQKVIASTDDICEILEVNKSVNKTLISASHLEQVLYDKMESLKDFCCDNEYCCDGQINCLECLPCNFDDCC